MSLDVVMYSCFQGYYYILCVGKWQTLLPVRIKSGKREIEIFIILFIICTVRAYSGPNRILPLCIPQNIDYKILIINIIKSSLYKTRK